ncbi:peptidylprolyl isomerase [candidate division FCPU426 bacterium]|nr:peptidylprolyl isomerase [candidate division FCPU426 bacterium]
MKKILTIAGVALVGGSLFSLGFFSKYLAQRFYNQPRVLVMVNNKKIMDTDLKREMRFLQVSENMAFSDITREDILDRMINDCLILEEAERQQVSIPENKIEEYVEKFWEDYKPDEVERVLKSQQLTQEEWRNMAHKRLLVERTIEKAVEAHVHVGEDEVEEFYWTHLLQFYRQDRLHARQIVVETEEQANTLKGKLDQGAAFKQLATEYSRGPEKDQGGDLGWVEKTDLPQAFSRVLFQMRPGQYSTPVATQYGYHIFYVEERERGGKIPLAEAKKMISKDLRLQKTDQAFRVWLENLRAQAVIQYKNRQGVD